MDKIRTLIADFNRTSARIFSDMKGYNQLLELPKASDADLAKLQEICGLALPEDLKAFYKAIGGLVSQDNDETHCFHVLPAAKFIDELKGTGSLRIRSMGVVDMVLASWGNSRPELKEAKNLSREQIQALNANFKCFGHYRTDTVMESASYLYFNKQGDFGEVYYDQDDFGEFHRELKRMLAGTAPTSSLENLLTEALHKVKKTMIEWNE